MPHSRRRATGLVRGMLLGFAFAAPTAARAQGQSTGQTQAQAQAGPRPEPRPEPPVRLFRLVTMRGDVLLGLTPREVAALGTGAEVERVARRIAQDGQITGWRYEVTRAADGGTQLAARIRVAVLRQDALTVEPYAPALPVLAPPDAP